MYIVSKNEKKVVNLSKYDYIELDEAVIYAYRGNNYTVLGEYSDKDAAREEFCSVIAALSSKDESKVIRMN